MELLFKALADQTRLRLIHLLGNEEVCVCDCVEVLKANQPKISRHLAYLRRAGLVAVRRDGKWSHYRLKVPRDPHAMKMLTELRKWLADNPQMQSDKAQLEKLRCTPTTPVANAAPQFPDAHPGARANQ